MRKCKVYTRKTCRRFRSAWRGKNAKKGRPAAEDLRDLRASFCLAQEMGEGLGRGEILL